MLKTGRSAKKEHITRVSENLEPKQYFIKNEAFPIEVSNNRYKLLPDPQVLKKEKSSLHSGQSLHL